jgi:hypothetical protein
MGEVAFIELSFDCDTAIVFISPLPCRDMTALRFTPMGIVKTRHQKAYPTLPNTEREPVLFRC